MELDKKLKDGSKEAFEDPDYEAYDKETEETDSQLSYQYEADPLPKGASGKSPPIQETDEEEDWEDVETDDLDN